MADRDEARLFNAKDTKGIKKPRPLRTIQNSIKSELFLDLVRPRDMDINNKSRSSLDVDPETDKVATKIVNCAFKVHQTLGPGLLESAYEICLAQEMGKCGLRVERQKRSLWPMTKSILKPVIDWTY